MADRLKINREQLAKFCPDAETIKQFEKLFARVSSTTDDSAVEDMAADVVAIGARASLALDMVSMLEPSNVTIPEPDVIPNVTFEGTPVDALSFNSSSSAPLDVGSLARKGEALEVTLPLGIQAQVGMSTSLMVRNDTAAVIPVGSVVYSTGAVNGVLSVDLFMADGMINQFLVLGVTKTEIPIGGFGYVAYYGHVSGVDTSAWTPGSGLWSSETVPGGMVDYGVWTQVVRVGFVLDSQVNGNILVSVSIA